MIAAMRGVVGIGSGGRGWAVGWDGVGLLLLLPLVSLVRLRMLIVVDSGVGGSLAIARSSLSAAGIHIGLF